MINNDNKYKMAFKTQFSHKKYKITVYNLFNNLARI